MHSFDVGVLQHILRNRSHAKAVIAVCIDRAECTSNVGLAIVALGGAYSHPEQKQQHIDAETGHPVPRESISSTSKHAHLPLGTYFPILFRAVSADMTTSHCVHSVSERHHLPM